MTDGANKGHLEYVLFVATNGMETHKWSSTNTGTYVEDLSRIVPVGNAEDIYTHLLRGEPVLFPVLFDLDQVRRKLRGIDGERLLNDM
jgi:hypothetical protein